MLWELTSIWSGQYRINASIGDGSRVLPDCCGGVKAGPLTVKHIRKSAICASPTLMRTLEFLVKYNLIWEAGTEKARCAMYRWCKKKFIVQDTMYAGSSKINYSFIIVYKKHILILLSWNFTLVRIQVREWNIQDKIATRVKLEILARFIRQYVMLSRLLTPSGYSTTINLSIMDDDTDVKNEDAKTSTSVSRPEVQCYENQTSVGLVPRWYVTNFPAFSYSPFVFSKWAVQSRATSSCTGQQIRNQRRSTLRKKKELLEEYLARRASILGGDIRPLVTHSSMRELRGCLSLYQKKEKERKRESKTIGGNRSWNRLAKEDFLMQRTFDGRIVLPLATVWFLREKISVNPMKREWKVLYSFQDSKIML